MHAAAVQTSKSFLFLFFKKEILPCFLTRFKKGQEPSSWPRFRYYFLANKSDIGKEAASQAWFRHGRPKPVSSVFNRLKCV